MGKTPQSTPLTMYSKEVSTMGEIYSVGPSAYADGIIPAIYDEKNEVVVFCQNGISSKFFNNEEFDDPMWNSSMFNLFCTKQVDEGVIAYFTRLNEDCEIELWQTYNVRRKGKKKHLYTVMRPCPPNTKFCECEDCGSRFVLNGHQCQFYEEKGWKIPTYRCPHCREVRRIRASG